MRLCRYKNHMVALSGFSKRKAVPDGLNYYCKECDSEHGAMRSLAERADRGETKLRRGKNATAFMGFLRRKYMSMRTRVTNRKQVGARYYLGLYILPFEEFIEHALQEPKIKELYDTWVALGKPHRECPTPDRIDSTAGYAWNNIEWVTCSINATRANNKRWGKK